jgi:Ni/Fe-hydrogenase subunit HybB-like protein
MTLFWFYFTFAEYLTTFYGKEPVQTVIFWSKLTGRFAPCFWAMALLCFAIPLAILIRRKTRTPLWTLIASVSVIIGMWLERFVIIVPTLVIQRMPPDQAIYNPTWVEWSILGGCVAFFLFLYLIFTKVFPIVPIWEIREGRERATSAAAERIISYMPETGTFKE